MGVYFWLLTICKEEELVIWNEEELVIWKYAWVCILWMYILKGQVFRFGCAIIKINIFEFEFKKHLVKSKNLGNIQILLSCKLKPFSIVQIQSDDGLPIQPENADLSDFFVEELFCNWPLHLSQWGALSGELHFLLFQSLCYHLLVRKTRREKLTRHGIIINFSAYTNFFSLRFW